MIYCYLRIVNLSKYRSPSAIMTQKIRAEPYQSIYPQVGRSAPSNLSGILQRSIALQRHYLSHQQIQMQVKAMHQIYIAIDNLLKHDINIYRAGKLLAASITFIYIEVTTMHADQVHADYFDKLDDLVVLVLFLKVKVKSAFVLHHLL